MSVGGMKRKQVRDEFKAAGLSIRGWAKANGYKAHTVYQVLCGRQVGLYGEGFAVAQQLGLSAPLTAHVQGIGHSATIHVPGEPPAPLLLQLLGNSETACLNGYQPEFEAAIASADFAEEIVQETCPRQLWVLVAHLMWRCSTASTTPTNKNQEAERG